MICAVFLASGRSLRFGGVNKLLYEVEGVPMAERAFRLLPAGMSGFVVTGWDEVKALAHKYDALRVVDNPDGADDVSVTIRRGVAALPENAGGAMFFVCDQPFLTGESVRRLTEAFAAAPDKIYVLSHGERSGNPCVFPRRFFAELSALPYDKGGKTLVRRHPDSVVYVEAFSERELDDMDVIPILD